jgi:hypothetical protein
VLAEIPDFLYHFHNAKGEFQINIRDRNVGAEAQQVSSEGLRIQIQTKLLRSKFESLSSSCSGQASIDRFTVIENAVKRSKGRFTVASRLPGLLKEILLDL